MNTSWQLVRVKRSTDHKTTKFLPDLPVICHNFLHILLQLKLTSMFQVAENLPCRTRMMKKTNTHQSNSNTDFCTWDWYKIFPALWSLFILTIYTSIHPEEHDLMAGQGNKCDMRYHSCHRVEDEPRHFLCHTPHRGYNLSSASLLSRSLCWPMQDQMLVNVLEWTHQDLKCFTNSPCK